MALERTSPQLQDSMTPVLQSIAASMSLMISTFSTAQAALSAAFSTAQISAVRAELSGTLLLLSQYQERLQQLRNNPNPPSAPEWKPIQAPEVFANTGAERFQAELQAANQAIDRLAATQRSLSAQSAQIEVLPDGMREDIASVDSRIQALVDRIYELDSTPAYLRTDDSNNQLETMRAQLSQMTELQGSLSAAMSQMDISAANAAYQQLNSAINSVNQNLRNNFTEPTTNWQSVKALQVFMNTGAERFESELQAANQAANQLVTRQQAISAAARQMQVTPPGMLNDVAAVGNGIQALANRIQQLDDIPIDMRTDQVNNQLEGMRSQLGQINNLQDRLNTAMSEMNVNEANTLYQQLNDAVNAANRGIRDNFSAQEQFNESIGSGSLFAGRLGGMIKDFAGQLFSKDNMSKAMNLSDEIAQTNTRLNLVNDGNQSPERLQNMIYDSSSRVGGSYLNTANTVSNLGNTAGSVFGSTEEIVGFTEQLNKQYAISGTSAEDAQAVTSQITQALANGSISGDELNSILGQAPAIVQSIADYMQVPVQELEAMASQGDVSAAVIKNAMFAAANETNQKFAQMPMTFEQIGNVMKTGAIAGFQPVLEKVNEIANSPGIQAFAEGIIGGLQILAAYAVSAFDLIGQGITWAYENWPLLAPVIWGAAAAMAAWEIITLAMTLAATGLNLAILQNPLIWVVMLIGLIVAAIASWIDSVGGIQIAWLMCVDAVLTQADNLRAGLSYAWMLIQNKIDDFMYGVQVLKTNVLNTLGNMKVLGLTILEGFINGAIDQINKLIEFAGSITGISIEPISHVEFAANAALEEQINQAARAENLAASQEEIKNNKQARSWEYLKIKGQADEASAARRAEYNQLRKDKEARAAAQKNESQGFIPGDITSYAPVIRSAEDMTGDMTGNMTGNIAGNTGETASNTAALANEVDFLSEDLKYMRDAAEQEIINRFTLAELKIDVSNNNTLTTKTDFDDLGRVMEEATLEILSIAAEGA